MILYGTNPIAWANDHDRTIGADIPTEQILHEAGREIGFDGIEGGHRWPEDPVRLRHLLASYGLRYVTGCHSTRLLTRPVTAEIGAIQPHLARLRESGCAMCIVTEASNAIHGDDDRPLSQRPVLDADGMVMLGQRIEALAEYLSAEHITLVYQPQMGTVVQAPEEIDAFMAATGPATKLLFDTGHCYLAGGDPAAMLARHIGRVAHVHARNVRPDVMRRLHRDDLSYLDAVRRGIFTVPGDPEGAVDFLACLRLLARSGYQGWLVVQAEQDPARRNPLTYQLLGLTALRAMARAAGLERIDAI